MPDYQHISYVVAGRVATISLHRPQGRNGYPPRTADELAEAFDAADADESVRVVVFTGAGRDCCVGVDLSGGELDPTDGAGGMVSFLQRRSPEFTGTVPHDLPDHLPWLGGQEPRP